ncbi:hypothetical protein CR513_44998, partial [Mucuna pruriens]
MAKNNQRLKAMETQISNLATLMSQWAQGSFPTQIEHNPREEESQPTNISLQLVDIIITYPLGIADDVLKKDGDRCRASKIDLKTKQQDVDFKALDISDGTTIPTRKSSLENLGNQKPMTKWPKKYKHQHEFMFAPYFR